MGNEADEVERQIKETRDQMDENLGELEQRTASNAMHYGRIAVVVLGVAAVAGVGVLIYRRINRPTRREQLRRMLIETLKDLPDSLRDLPEEVTDRLKKSLPSVTVVVNRDDAARGLGTLERIVRRVAPAVAGTASNALINRFRTAPERPDDTPSRSTIPAYE
jgi:transposase